MNMRAVPRVGFVLEQSLGHITHADNLRRLVPDEPAVDAEFLDIAWEATGLSAKLPVFKSNWTVRAGIRAWRGIRAMHRRDPLDALFIHTQVPAVLSSRWLTRVPGIVSVDATPLQYDQLGEHYAHETGGERIEKLKWTANRTCFRRAVHIVSWSEWAKQGVVDGYGIAPDKVTVIPPGVDPARWARAEPRQPNAEPLRLLFVGGDLERKGGTLLLDAFHRLLEERGGAGLELHLVTKSEVEPSRGVFVHRGMLPNSPELIALYHLCDVFCLPTRGDCLPMVLSEAGAAGMPLISTSVGAIGEIVRDGETGFLIPVDDAAALTAAIRRLADDDELRARLGTQATELVGRQFDAKKNAQQLTELLHSIARTPAGE